MVIKMRSMQKGLALLAVAALFFILDTSLLKLNIGGDSIATTKTTDRVNGNTGHVFTGEQIRNFTGSKKLSPALLEKRIPNPLQTKVDSCSQWAVVTTINAPTDGVKSVASLPHWCLVIVGDTKTPENYMQRAGFEEHGFENRVHFLSVQDQKNMNNAFVDLMPYRSFARKNVGFLFAIRHGAKVIYDFDDDNVLLKRTTGLLHPTGYRSNKLRLGQSIVVQHLPSYVSNDFAPAFNPLPLMKPSMQGVWPRGFPLELVQDSSTTGTTKQLVSAELPLSSVAVIQSVCNKDPDFDAVYRLTRPLPVVFDNPHVSNNNLMVPMNSFVSYNAQATTHMYSAFWGLLLPYTVPGRVTDIWRAYFSQRIFHDLGLSVVYAPPLVVHERSEHNYIADMEAEGDLYLKTSALLNFLKDWKDTSDTLPERIENLAIALYERDYIGLADVESMQAWLIALQDIGYEFPELPQTPVTYVLSPLPSIQGQSFTVGTPYQFGGVEGITYEKFLKKEGPNFDQFVNEGKALQIWRPKELVTKIVTMAKDEWPIIKDWIYYHGHMFGFDNLYILDGSTNINAIDFLCHARDHLGVNVLFTNANLNKIGVEINEITKKLTESSDFLMKVDMDEFVGLQKDNARCETTEAVGNVDCTLSPFALEDFLKDLKNLHVLPPHARWKFNYTAASKLSREACESGLEHEVGEYTMIPTHPMEKALMDSRAAAGMDLGGHQNHWLEPFPKYPKEVVPFGVLHMHQRCLNTERENNRKALISHGYMLSEDDDQTAIQKLLSIIGSKTNNPCNTSATKLISSWHKADLYLKFLGNCSWAQPENFYHLPDNIFKNPDFKSYLATARAEYGTSLHPVKSEYLQS